MRIIAGEFRRRLLLTPRDADTTRPYPDRVKESLFSLLRGRCESARVYEAFAGVGTIGLEAVSRGAARCVMVERDRDVAALLQKNIDALGCGDRCEVVIGDALGAGALARCPKPADLVFIDPPYAMMRDPLGTKRVMAQLGALIDRLTPDGFAVLRTPWPLFHESTPAGESGAVDPARSETPRATPRDAGTHKKGKHRSHWRWEAEERAAQREGARAKPSRSTPRAGRRDDEEEVELDEAEWKALMEGDADAAPASGTERDQDTAEPAPPRPERTPVDLTLPNAVGPETHPYHSMAVHLYMRTKEPPPSRVHNTW